MLGAFDFVEGLEGAEGGIVSLDGVGGLDDVVEKGFFGGKGGGVDFEMGVLGGGHVGFGLPCVGVVEVLAEGVVAGEGAVEFAFEGVSGDVWGG